MPTIDFSDMEFGQSDIRNKILAPVFKKLRIIEQWGNGLKLIAEELQNYPEIGFEWKEPGMTFRVAFTNKNYRQQHESQHESQQELQQELKQELQQRTLFSKVLQLVELKTSSTKELSMALGQKEISGQLYSIVNKLKENGLIGWTIPNKPKSSKQQYRITQKGLAFLDLLKAKE